MGETDSETIRTVRFRSISSQMTGFLLTRTNCPESRSEYGDDRIRERADRSLDPVGDSRGLMCDGNAYTRRKRLNWLIGQTMSNGF